MKYGYSELTEKEYKFIKNLCRGFNHREGLRTMEWTLHAYLIRDNAGHKIAFVKSIPHDCIFMISVEEGQDIEDGKVIMRLDSETLYELGLKGN